MDRVPDSALNQAPRELPQPSWCRPCGIPHPPDARACLHCGQSLSGAETDAAVPGALTPLPVSATPAKRADLLTGRRAAKPTVDVEAEAAAIVARAMALEAASAIAPPDRVAACITVPDPMPGPAERSRYFQVNVRTTLQRAWLVAGLLLCLLLIVFALLIARDAAMLPR